MATDRKLISVYVPDDVLEALQQFQEDRGIRSGSSAVVDALREFFKLGTTADFAPIARVEELEQRLDQLSELVEELRSLPVRQKSSTPPRPQKPQKPAIALSEDVSAASSPNGWLTLKEVAESIGLNYTRLSATHQEMGEGSQEFLDYLFRKSSEANSPQRWQAHKAGRYWKYSIVVE